MEARASPFGGPSFRDVWITPGRSRGREPDSPGGPARHRPGGRPQSAAAADAIGASAETPGQEAAHGPGVADPRPEDRRQQRVTAHGNGRLRQLHLSLSYH